MLTMYSTIMGAAKMHMLRMSVVGVTMAAMIKMTRMEYRRFFHSHFALTIPISERKKIKIGISNTIPNLRMMVKNRLVYSLTVIMGLNCSPYPIRKASAAGYTSL